MVIQVNHRRWVLTVSTRLFMVACSVFLVSSTLEAQREESVGPHARADSSFVPRKTTPAVRLFTATSGVLVGTIAGGFVGYHVLPHECGCDDPGLDAIVYGAFFGMTVGAALGAAAPDLHSVCSFDKRFARSLAGAGITAIGAYLVAGGRGNGGTLLAIPLGAIGGSLAGLGRCWNSGSG